MAKTAKTAGKGRVVTSAPTRTRGSRAKTMVQAVAMANADNAKRRVRQFATHDGLLSFLDSLPAKRMPAKMVDDKTTAGAVARREWCEANGIPLVAVYDDGIADRRNDKRPVHTEGDKAGQPNTDKWRPDNAVYERLDSLANIGGRFGVTRYETAPVQTKKACDLNWTKGLPPHFEGADLVYIYRT